MTGRRRHRPSPVAWIVAAAAVALAAVAAAHLAGFLAAAGAIGTAGYALGRRHRPVTLRPAHLSPASPPVASAAELARLRAERERLAAELAEARASATAAWDAAASRPPSPPRAAPAPLVDRLVADPLSGVHRLGPG
jgi:hypothetical protein